MPDLKGNNKYNNSFEQMTKTAFDLADTLPDPEKLSSKEKTKAPKRQDVDLDKFNNIRNVSQQNQPQQTTKTSSLTPSQLGPVTVPYGGSTRFEEEHPGVDVAMETGEEVPAFAGGKVTEVREGKQQTSNLPGFGNYVVIEDEQGNKHRYSHLHEAWVEEGQEVSPGDVIGGAGHTGGAYSTTGGSGTHLDYRIKNAYEKYMNPSDYLGDISEEQNENENEEISFLPKSERTRWDFLPQELEGAGPREAGGTKTRNQIYQNKGRIYSPFQEVPGRGSTYIEPPAGERRLREDQERKGWSPSRNV